MLLDGSVITYTYLKLCVYICIYVYVIYVYLCVCVELGVLWLSCCLPGFYGFQVCVVGETASKIPSFSRLREIEAALKL